MIQRIPEYALTGQEWITQFCKDMGWSDNIWNELINAWNQFEFNFSQFAQDTATIVFDFTVGFTTGLFNFFLGLVFSIYMLYSKEKLVGILKKLCYALIKTKYADKIIEIAHEANLTFARFIGGQITEAVILGVLCFIGMAILRIPYAPLISVMIGVTSLIPIIGAFIGTIPAALRCV